MYSFRNYVFPISLEMMLMHSLEMNTCQYQVFELTNQIQCIVRKSISYVTYCADTDADRASPLLLFMCTQQCVSTVKTTEKKYVNFILVSYFQRVFSLMYTLFHAILTFTVLVKILRMFEDGSF